MIALRPMTSTDFPAYLDYFIADYSVELSNSYDLGVADAEERARREISSDLPDGALTVGQSLYCIEAVPGITAGYLWLRKNVPDNTAFVMDFYILPEERGKGLGRAALSKAEQMLAAENIHELRLRVASGNDVALNLYGRSGFQITGINMQKRF